MGFCFENVGFMCVLRLVECSLPAKVERLEGFLVFLDYFSFITLKRVSVE